MTQVVRIVCVGLVLSCVSCAGPPRSARPQALHFQAIVVDTHADTTQRLLARKFDLGTRHPDGSVDIPRAREGGVDALFFSIYVPGTVTGQAAVDRARLQVAAVQRQVASHPGDLVLATTAADVRQAAADGRIAVLMGIEGGHMIANDLENLRRLFDDGARYLTLTHNLNVDWADAAVDQPRHDGLNALGRDVVREMNRLGMIVDVSHVSDATFDDVLAVSEAPVLASHSSSRALCNVPRNMSDRMIHALAARGGVIQVTFHMSFLSQQHVDAMRADDARIGNEIEAVVDQRCGADEACYALEKAALVREYVAAGRLPRVEWTRILDHIDHVVGLVGVDHVGIGSDFDGAVMPYGMEDAASLPRLTGALLARGYSPEAVRKILGGNTLRLMEQVEAIAHARARAQHARPDARPRPRRARRRRRAGPSRRPAGLDERRFR